MSPTGTRCRPTLDELEHRQVLNSNALADSLGTVPAPHSVAEVSVPITAQNIHNRHSLILGTSTEPEVQSSLNPNRSIARSPGEQQVTLNTLKAFTVAYLTTSHDALYNPAVDVNHNGFIGQGDGKLLLRELNPLTKEIPLKVNLILAPQDQAHGHVSSNSGGHTFHKDVTILGHTTPGSLVFSDSGFGDYSFTGPATYSDQNGNFSFKFTNSDGINNFEVLVIDPYGQQTILDYPIFWIPFAAKGSRLK
jgi:hypothetical protein